MSKHLLAGALAAYSRIQFGDTADADLLARFAEGRDEAAFAELLRRYGPLVWRTARHALGNHADAEDVFQATFLALARSAKRIRRPEALAGWLHRTAHRLAIRVRRRTPSVPAPPPRPSDPLDRLTARELLAAVDEGIAALPEAVRVPLVLCGVEGLSQDEAAKRLGWSAGSVRGRLERGRRRLRAWLGTRGLTVPAALGGVTVVPAEVAAAAMAAVRGSEIAPAIAELVAGATEMAASFWWKPAAAAVVVLGGLTAAIGPFPQSVRMEPQAAAAPVPELSPVLWSYPLSWKRVGNHIETGIGFGAYHAVFTPDGEHVVVAGTRVLSSREWTEKGIKYRSAEYAGEIQILDAGRGKLVRTFAPPTQTQYSSSGPHIAIRPDGKRIAVGGQTHSGEEDRIDVWGWKEGELLAQLWFPNLVSGLAYSRDGRTLTGIDANGRILRFDGETGKELAKLDYLDAKKQHYFRHLAVDGGEIAVQVFEPASETLTIWDTRTGDEVKAPALPRKLKVNSASISADGKRLVIHGYAGDDTNTFVFFDVAVTADGTIHIDKMRTVESARFGMGWCSTAALSPNGKYLAAIWVRTVAILDARTCEPIATAKWEHAEGSGVGTLDFSPDGKKLLSVGHDAVKVWSVDALLKRSAK